jgi:hypothetical protein
MFPYVCQIEISETLMLTSVVAAALYARFAWAPNAIGSDTDIFSGNSV